MLISIIYIKYIFNSNINLLFNIFSEQYDVSSEVSINFNYNNIIFLRG